MNRCTLLSANESLNNSSGYHRHIRGRNCILTTAGMHRASASQSTGDADIRTALRNSVRTGLSAARQNAKAIIAIQVFLLLLLLSYYCLPVTRPFFNGIESVQAAMGLSFGFVAFGLGSGVLGEVLRLWQDNWRWSMRNVENLAFNTLVYGTFGVISALKFEGYAWLLGSVPTFGVILGKLLIDQCLYGPMFFNPLSAVIWFWKGSRYDGRATANVLKRPAVFYVQRVLPVQLTNWALWIPTTIIVVSLPTQLQLPTVVLGMVAWQILMSAIAASGNRQARRTPGAVLSPLRVNWGDYRLPQA